MSTITIKKVQWNLSRKFKNFIWNGKMEYLNNEMSFNQNIENFKK